MLFILHFPCFALIMFVNLFNVIFVRNDSRFSLILLVVFINICLFLMTLFKSIPFGIKHFLFDVLLKKYDMLVYSHRFFGIIFLN